jgi:hypothetical protein
MFFLALDFIMFVFLLHECARTKYPDLYEDLSVKFMYYSLYMYSIGEEVFNEHIYPIFVHDEIVKNNLDLILDNGENYTTDTELLPMDQNVPDDYKFAIYTRLNDNNTVRKKRIYKQLPEDGVYDCDETSYKFILIEVKYGDTIAKLKFDNPKTTYYVVNNEFDSNVIRYLMHEDFDVELPEQYKVCVLDHNVSSVEFDETQAVRLNKDNYEIISCRKSENDDESDENKDNN